LTSFLNWDRIFLSYRRDLYAEERGAEGAIPGHRKKLSGKRTVTYVNPGKIPPFD